MDPKELINNRQKLKEEMLDKYGYLFCEHCHKSKAYKFEVHHIVYRSEQPNHKNLHNIKNLIIVCSECHQWFHRAKQNRLYLHTERKLGELFN